VRGPASHLSRHCLLLRPGTTAVVAKLGNGTKSRIWFFGVPLLLPIKYRRSLRMIGMCGRLNNLFPFGTKLRHLWREREPSNVRGVHEVFRFHCWNEQNSFQNAANGAWTIGVSVNLAVREQGRWYVETWSWISRVCPVIFVDSSLH
jgi:hypothetical protein